MDRIRGVALDSPPTSRSCVDTLHSLWPPAIVGLASCSGCLAGFALRFPASGISFFWPPTAALTAALLLVAPRAWPRILAGAFVAHVVAHARDGVPITAWLIQFVGNGFHAVLAAVVAERWSRTQPLLSDIRSVLAFVAGACIAAPAIASLIPAAVYVPCRRASSSAGLVLVPAIQKLRNSSVGAARKRA